MSNPTPARWGAYSIGASYNQNEPLFDFHIARIPWLGILRIILGRLSINVTYPITMPDVELTAMPATAALEPAE